MSLLMKTWLKTEVAGSMPTYFLTKEANQFWFAKVYFVKGSYTFILGKRIVEGEPIPPRYSWNKKGFKSPATAKARALKELNLVMLQGADE